MTRCILKTFICLSLFFLTACPEKKSEENSDNQLKQPTKVLDYLALSAHYFVSQQQSDGFFRYEYDFITGNYTHWDNVVHQTRSGYTLIQYYIFLMRNNVDPHIASIILNSAQNALNGYVSASVTHSDMPGQLISFYYNKGGTAITDIPRRQSAEYRIQRLEAEISATAFALATEAMYWGSTSDASYAETRKEWRDALIYHAKQAINSPIQKKAFMPAIWAAFSIYNQIEQNDKEVNELLPLIDIYFVSTPRPMKDVEDYTWDMIAANQRHLITRDSIFQKYAARQTTQVIENLYAQHDTGVNSCELALGLVEASLILTGSEGEISRIEQTALGRSQLEYYSSLKYTILPNQTWIALGPGRTLHSQDFRRFAGASIYGLHTPRTNIGLVQMCLLSGMRFSNEDLKELKQMRSEQ